MRKGLLPTKNVKGTRPLVFDIGLNQKSRFFSRVLNWINTKEVSKSSVVNLCDNKNVLKSRKRKVSFIFVVLFYIVVFVSFTVLFHKSIIAQVGKTAKVNFYASESFSENSWENISKALGEEEVSRSGELELFDNNNSAVYGGGEGSLILKGFITKEYINEDNGEMMNDGGIGDLGLEIGTTTDDDGNFQEEEFDDSEEVVLEIDEEVVVENIEEPVYAEISDVVTEVETQVVEEKEEEKKEVSLLNGFENFISFGMDKIKNNLLPFKALADWGGKGDDRNIIFGEFKSAKIKLSLAVLEEFVSNIVEEEKEIVEEDVVVEEEIAVEENITEEGDVEEENEFENSEENILEVEEVIMITNSEDEIKEVEEDVVVESVEEEVKDVVVLKKEVIVEEIIIPEEEEEEVILEDDGFLDKVLDFFAPKEVEAEEGDTKIVVWYSFANNEFEGPWKELYEINYNQFSNYINHGYLSIDAPFLNSWKDIDDLRLKFEGRVDGASFVAYLDSVWVEAEYKIEINEEFDELLNEDFDKNRLIIDGEEIVFNHTDENENENLIIKSNSKDYVGLTEATVYFSIENIGSRKEEIDIHFYFPEGSGEVASIEKLERNKPYFADVKKYEAEVYTCENRWDKREEGYLCYPDEKLIACDEVSPNRRYCRVEGVKMVSEKEVKYKHVWEDIKLGRKFIPEERGFFKKLLGLGPQEKQVPEKFEIEKSTDENGIVVLSGEAQYFKATIKFDPNSLGEFYIESVGDADGYGLLDPWWSSSWNYRMPIAIDNTLNSDALTEYQVYVEIASTSVEFWENVKSDGGDIRFMNSAEDTELDFWMQYFDYTASSAAFWVQVDSIPSATTSDIFVYYGNSSATTTSDQYTPFTYSTMQNVFYMVANHTSMTIDVVSLIDNNEVQVDGQTSVALNRQQTTSFSLVTPTSTLRVKGPVAVIGGSNVNGSDMLFPVSFVGTEFVIPSERGDEQFNIYATTTSATVDIYNNGGASPVISKSLVNGEWHATSTAIGAVATIESNNPIMLHFYNLSGATARDGIIPYPVTTRDLYGVYSGSYYTAGIADASFNVYCSSGASTTVSSLSRGSRSSNPACTGGSEGTGNAVRIENGGVGLATIQQADGDGSETSAFWPFKEFSTEYMIPTNAAYVAVVCAPESGSIVVSVYDETDIFVASTTCSSVNGHPGKVYFGTNGDTTYINAGARIVSDSGPFYAYYEDVSVAGGGEETNLSAAVQARKYSHPHPTQVFGEHEILGEPTATFNSVVAKEDGSGTIDISIEVDDVSNEDVMVKIEYEIGTSCIFSLASSTTLDETPANITADYGTVVIENDSEYQVGTSTGLIQTAPGSNTVAFDWLTKSDMDDGVEEEYCLRLTANDGSSDQLVPATTTVAIDSINPTAPGVLVYKNRTGNSVTIGLGATSSDTFFKEYRIYYKVHDGTPVTASDSYHGTNQDGNLGLADFDGATTTVVTGLDNGVTYTFDIWAVDYGGNISSSTLGIDVLTNEAPTTIFNSVNLKTDGSGAVDISLEVDDAENSNQVRVKIEYEVGASCEFIATSVPTLDITPSSVSADFGLPVIDNDENYQIGSTSAWILTSPGSNTIQFDWLSKVDIDNATGTYCLRVTAYEGLDDQFAPATTTIYIDNIVPTIPGNLSFGDIGFNDIQLIFGDISYDENVPGVDVYKIFYKMDTSGVSENDSEHDSSDFNFHDYNGATSTIVTSLSAGSDYVFNIWAYDSYGNTASATSEIVTTTDSSIANKSLVFINPESAGTSTNIVVADGSSVYKFRAVVSDISGWETLDEVYLRFANINDSSSPYSDLSFRWREASDGFVEVGSDSNDMVSISGTSVSSCSSDSCTLDFDIIFNKTFVSTSTEYAVEIYSVDDLAREDSDDYPAVFQVRKTWLDQIHYRWRNDDGGG